MILAETVQCTTSIETPEVVDAAQLLVTSVECDLQSSGFPWATLWQALAAFGTLIAVGIAVWQTHNARQQAKAARQGQEAAEARLLQHATDERHRRASRLSVWVETSKGLSRPELRIRNASEDAMYDVTVYHNALSSLGQQSFDIVPPGEEYGFVLSPLYLTGPNTGKPVASELVRVTMTDALGHTYERHPDHRGLLTEISPCGQ